MRFFIEVERQGPKGTALVTLRDGSSPKIGEVLQDEDGDAWRVVGLRDPEVELLPIKPKDLPKGMTLADKNSAHVAA